MVVDLASTLEAVGGIITALGGLAAAIRSLSAKNSRKKEEYRKEILDHARSEMDKIQQELESKIKNIEFELQSQKDDVTRNFGFLKESYVMEMKTLSEKIENVRDQLNQQHMQLVALLTKLVDGR